MPLSKDGLEPRINTVEVSSGFKETAPGIITHPIGEAEASIKTPAMRMGAAKPWVPKGGHAVVAANAHDPPSSKPSMRVQKKKAAGPGGMVSGGVPAGQQNSGGYLSANSIGGYSAAQE